MSKLRTCGEIAVMVKATTKQLANFISLHTTVVPDSYEPCNGTDRALYNNQQVKVIKKSYLKQTERKDNDNARRKSEQAIRYM